jgi:hypothetical protein
MKRIGFANVCIAVIASLVVGVFAACSGKPAKPTLTLTKTTYLPGEGITVRYTALSEYDSNAWIGIIPSNVPHGSEAENDRHDITYQYLKKSTGGEKTFAAPAEPGTYDLRMHNADANGVEVASVTFVVSGPAGQGAAAKGTEQKGGDKSFKVGDPVMVEWKGSWWPAKVIGIRKGNTPYKIHYDGYSSSWDEWIGSARIKNKQ